MDLFCIITFMLFAISSTQIFITAYTQSDIFGRLIIISLFFLSLLCWIVLLHKSWQMREIKKIGSEFLHKVRNSKEPILNSHFETQPLKSEYVDPFRTIFQSAREKTFEILEKNLYFLKQALPNDQDPPVFVSENDLALIESHLVITISSEAKRLEKNLFVLSTIVTLAPFLGLLGTVWGILITFSHLHSGATLSSNSAILGGISTALVTTVLGLLIAIPALIAFNTLKTSLKNITSDLESFSFHLLDKIAFAYLKVEIYHAQVGK